MQFFETMQNLYQNRIKIVKFCVKNSIFQKFLQQISKYSHKIENLNFAQTSTFKTQKKQFSSNLNLSNLGGMNNNDNNDPPLSKKNTMVNKSPRESNTNLKNLNSAVITSK